MPDLCMKLTALLPPPPTPITLIIDDIDSIAFVKNHRAQVHQAVFLLDSDH